MTITVDPTATVLDELSVELGVHEGKTKTVHRIRRTARSSSRTSINPTR